MDFDPVLIAGRREDMVERGLWHDRTVNDYLDGCVASHPDKPALTALRAEDGETRRFSYRELAAMADRIAVGLARLGIGRNDVVACQLPNWWQFTALYLGCSRIGAVLNPLMTIFRERELTFMLSHGRARAVVAPKRFRGFDYEGDARRHAGVAARPGARADRRRRRAPTASRRACPGPRGSASPTPRGSSASRAPGPTTSPSSSTPPAPPASPRA